jgi:hypothetical protein
MYLNIEEMAHGLPSQNLYREDILALPASPDISKLPHPSLEILVFALPTIG